MRYGTADIWIDGGSAGSFALLPDPPVGWGAGFPFEKSGISAIARFRIAVLRHGSVKKRK